MTKTLYVKSEDMQLWEQAEKLADERGISLSQLIFNALSIYLMMAGKKGR